MLAGIGRNASAGAIVGLSAVIYSLSYGALLFSGPLAGFVGFGITIALISAVAGALFGTLSEGKAFIGGPDSNTISLLASVLAVLGSLELAPARMLEQAVLTVVVTTLLCAAGFYAIARAGLASLVRYIPYSVTAGFLAATGWLVSSGALNIIAGTPLTLAGMANLAADPARPELAAGILVAGALFVLAPRVSSAILIPAVMLAATLAVGALLAACQAPRCRPELWLFTAMSDVQWLPPWRLSWSLSQLEFVLQQLPGILVVAFVGLLTVLLSVASLELSFRQEFRLDKVLNDHARLGVVSAALGGAMPIISIARTELNRRAGGGALAGAIAAAICLGALLGASQVVAYIPRAALGGLVLYLGLGMLKQWVWDQRRAMTKLELGQIVLILGLVANYGFLVGFSAGVVISCVMFVMTYSRIPLVDLATNLSLFTSPVVRPEHEAEALRRHGDKALLYRLRGYMFFGSASRIDELFRQLDNQVEAVVLDFSNVSGIDSSAIGIFQRMLRRHSGRPVRFFLVYAPRNEARLRAIAAGLPDDERIGFFPSLDRAVETAEDHIIAGRATSERDDGSFGFLHDPAQRAAFLAYCERRLVRKGERLCTERERSDELFFLESGSLEVIQSGSGSGGELRLAKLRHGAMVGELAFYTGEPRTASIVAADDASVYVLTRAALQRLRVGHPELAVRFDHMVIRRISEALTRTSKLVAAFR